MHSRSFLNWPYSIPEQNGQSIYIPDFRRKRRKNPTRWGGTTYTAYIREYSPPSPPPPGAFQVVVTCDDIYSETTLGSATITTLCWLWQRSKVLVCLDMLLFKTKTYSRVLHVLIPPSRPKHTQNVLSWSSATLSSTTFSNHFVGGYKNSECHTST